MASNEPVPREEIIAAHNRRVTGDDESFEILAGDEPQKTFTLRLSRITWSFAAN